MAKKRREKETPRVVVPIKPVNIIDEKVRLPKENPRRRIIE
jgi:hypothetical protein